MQRDASMNAEPEHLSAGSAGRRRAALSSPAEAAGDSPPQVRPAELARLSPLAAGWARQFSPAAASPTTAFASCCFLRASRSAIPIRSKSPAISYVSRAAITDKFTPDLGKSILRVPLDARRARAGGAFPGSQQASVERALPNRIRVEVDRAHAGRLSAHRQSILRWWMPRASFSIGRSKAISIFPSSAASTRPCRWPIARERMTLFRRIHEGDRPGASRAPSDQVSEVDLSDAQDVRATLGGPARARRATPICVHFGDCRFREQVSPAARQYRPVARQRRARGVGGPAILAAGGGESRASDRARRANAGAQAAEALRPLRRLPLTAAIMRRTARSRLWRRRIAIWWRWISAAPRPAP